MFLILIEFRSQIIRPRPRSERLREVLSQSCSNFNAIVPHLLYVAVRGRVLISSRENVHWQGFMLVSNGELALALTEFVYIVVRARARQILSLLNINNFDVGDANLLVELSAHAKSGSFRLLFGLRLGIATAADRVLSYRVVWTRGGHLSGVFDHPVGHDLLFAISERRALLLRLVENGGQVQFRGGLRLDGNGFVFEAFLLRDCDEGHTVL